MGEGFQIIIGQRRKRSRTDPGANWKECRSMCDPTMYLSAEKWRNVEKEPKSRLKNSPYILTYFLGDCEASYKIWVENLAEKNHMKIFELQNEENFGIAPDEFLYLIDHAACVCTDSFHGTVFSLIFHTPFVVFERRDNFKTMSSRLSTLLTLFNCLEQHQKVWKNRMSFR